MKKHNIILIFLFLWRTVFASFLYGYKLTANRTNKKTYTRSG